MEKFLQLLQPFLSALLAFLMSCNVALFGSWSQTPPAETETYAGKAQAVYQAIHSKCYSPLTNHYLEQAYTSNVFPNVKPAYLWPLSSVFDGILALNEYSGGAQAKQLEKMVRCLNGYYNKDKAPAYGLDSSVVALGGGERYYDDNMWIGLAYCELYAQTGESAYLQKAQEIYTFCTSGYDDALGGGIYWREGDTASKHTCSNGPQILLALQLYLLGGKTEEEYLYTAQKLYDWVNTNLRAPQKVYWDNIRTADGSVEKTTWTYNTGTMLQATVLLYMATGNKFYYHEAQDIAAASLAHFAPQGEFPDSKWFNAVLLRAYVAVYEMDSNDSYILAMKNYADAVWAQQRDAKSNLIGNGSTWSLINQGGMLEIYATLAAVLEEKEV